MAPETGSPFTRNFPTSVTCSILNEIFCTKHCRLKSNNKTHRFCSHRLLIRKIHLFHDWVQNYERVLCSPLRCNARCQAIDGDGCRLAFFVYHGKTEWRLLRSIHWRQQFQNHKRLRGARTMAMTTHVNNFRRDLVMSYRNDPNSAFFRPDDTC